MCRICCRREYAAISVRCRNKVDLVNSRNRTGSKISRAFHIGVFICRCQIVKFHFDECNITGSANLLASLFSGSLVLEIIFAYPGVGRLMYEAVLQEDINLVLANSMFISALVLTGMVVSDILLAVLDPRIRYGKE